MKNLFLFIFCGFSFYSYAQVHSAITPEASSFYNYAMQSIKPEIKNLIRKKANSLKGKTINTESLSDALKKEPLLHKMNQHDLEAISVLIMVQVSENTDADLKNLVMKMRRKNEQSTFDSIKTETLLDQKSDIAKSINMAMKKISPSQESAINNLK
ncbi:MAG: hypothetical protein Q8891_11300 [Bacteroidota bacterium]|nr:hypothetical protein [Bacteroidota bacterium]